MFKHGNFLERYTTQNNRKSVYSDLVWEIGSRVTYLHVYIDVELVNFLEECQKNFKYLIKIYLIIYSIDLIGRIPKDKYLLIIFLNIFNHLLNRFNWKNFKR